jgi:hypothetical protein
MSKMAFDILLKCVEHTECTEICAMASAKLHALVQTRFSLNKNSLSETKKILCYQ